MDFSYSTPAFEEAYTYNGSDLGATWTEDYTIFRVWAPTAHSVSVNLYQSGNYWEKDRIWQLPMERSDKGTWVAYAEGDLNGVYYTYEVYVENRLRETCDPYARTTGVNGIRAMVLNLASTNPAGWENDRDPHFDTPILDCILYELHLRDFSMNAHSGIRHKGKYLALTETGTRNKKGYLTGLDYLKHLGFTHLHLLPIADFGSVDESNLSKAQYNWGYDPVNYNVPEGSYATDPFHGEVRVRELKQAVKSLHDHGISVVMDVVYNHVYHTDGFCFNQIVPGYFSRFDQNGHFYNGSMCGNETASERSMVQKYIVDSVNYWADEYHIDGFRFDIASLLDTDTVNEIIQTVHLRHPNVIFYGEGWNMNAQATKPQHFMTEQQNSWRTPGMAFFNDAIRDTLRGPLFDTSAQGFLTGNPYCREGLDQCFTASNWWSQNPSQIVNYLSCHDNHTLFDRIQMALPEASQEEKVKRNLLGAAFLFLSQGIPFFPAGEELMRSKKKRNGSYEENSYKSSDRLNAIRWDALNDPLIQQSVGYYAGLIALRKSYPLLRQANHNEINTSIVPLDCGTGHAAAYMIYDTNIRMLCVLNASTEELTTSLPYGDWHILVKEYHASPIPCGTIHTAVQTPPLSASVLIQYK